MVSNKNYTILQWMCNSPHGGVRLFFQVSQSESIIDMTPRENKKLIERMATNGFTLVDGFFHRHIYTGRKLYSDVVKFEDALNWLEKPVLTEKIRDEDIIVYISNFGNDVYARLPDNGLIYASYSGYRDKRLTDEQVSAIHSVIR